MKLRKNIFLLCALAFLSVKALAQRSEAILTYIETYRQLAIDEMIRSGVPASITLAQGIHETEAGRSDLVLRSNNHFGIKCKTGWNGDKVYHDDDAEGECFRKYDKAETSYRDHSDFLRKAGRYSFLFDLDPTDYKGWAYGLKKAGYATNIKYSQILIKLIEDYNLEQYTEMALGKVPLTDDMLTQQRLTNTPASTTVPPIETVKLAKRPSINYPDGIFEINNTKVIHAKAGMSLLAIADVHQIVLPTLLDFNDMKQEDILVEDQLLYLQRKRKIGAHPQHTVAEGETLWSIAQEEGIRLESLCALNKIDMLDQPAVGEKLTLQTPTSQIPKLERIWNTMRRTGTEAASNTEDKEQASIIHTVAPKDNLYAIAKKYEVTVNEIKQWNHLTSGRLDIGQSLIIFKKPSYDTGTR